ncbi:uncharacterized protein GIQ15_04699 [Arthroderma uncinatum]|uniref:uncharacterized protein n=1 Tax=Arthroderma uncinatum TaxID=74035 RepID=UPI00144AF92E|nr:uncharacterized protein GIQ15_04699 [Arthroderma uncinatum]KAF3481940.1 hypothetical protein GIQ15_04699 [Arthroderma uncinatum]
MTTFTPTQHTSVYPAIDASLPELSQADRTVLITGGSFGIGFIAAQGFAKASASKIILLGRQRDSLVSACDRLRKQYPEFQGELITYVCDVGDAVRVAEVWDDLNKKAIAVDVLIVNACYFTVEGQIADIPLQLAWRGYERALINISSRLTHDHDASVGFGSYASTKIAFSAIVQHLATEVPVEQIQVLNVHPGDVYTEGVSKICEKDSWPDWDEPSLPENFLVWAASPAASFLHGRFVWANWDVTELKNCEALTDGKPENKQLLKLGVNGLVFAVPTMAALKT